MSVALADDVMLQEEGAPEMPGTEGTPEEGGESQPEQPETQGGVALAEGEEETGDKPEEEKGDDEQTL